MRGSLSGAYVRKTGDTMTGPLTISANVANLLSLNRPDGAAHNAIGFQRAGGVEFSLRHLAAQPRMAFVDVADALRLTLRDDTGLLGIGLIPLSMMRREEVSGENAGAIVVLAGLTTILDVSSTVNAQVGDRVRVEAKVPGTKGATAGDVSIELAEVSGTSGGAWANNESNVIVSMQALANETTRIIIAGTFRVTAAGPFTMRLRGTSTGSNYSIAATTADMTVTTMRDSA